MSDLPEKNRINVDDLVDQLVKRRENAAPILEILEPSSPPIEEPATPLPTKATEPEPEVDAGFAVTELTGSLPEIPQDIPDYDPIKVAARMPTEEADLILGRDDEESEEKPAKKLGRKPRAVREEAAEMPAPKRKLFGFLNRQKEEDEDEDFEDWGLKPIGHYRAEEPKPPVTEPVVEESPTVGNDEFPQVKSVAETITMTVVLPSGEALPRNSSDTRVLPAVADEAPAVAAEPVAAPKAAPSPMDDQLPDQLSLEEMVRVEDIEPDGETVEEDSDETPEERMRRMREEKARYFTIDEEEEPNEPEEEVIEEEDEAEAAEPEMEDFTQYEDSKAIAAELNERCRNSLLTLIFTGLLELALLVLTVLTFLTGEPPLGGVTGYLVAHLFILGLMMALNYSALGRGFSGVFVFRANSDTAPAIASLMALLNVVIHFTNTEIAPPYWAPLAGLLLTLCAAGHYIRAVGVRRNFAFVSYPGEKYAATLIEEDNALQEIGRRAAGNGEASVGYFHRTDFLSDYLTNAYEEHQGDDWSRWLTPAAFGLSVILSLVSLTGEGVPDFWSWLSVFVGMVCISMQATQLAVQLPLNHCSRVMLSRGGFLVGWKAVRQFGDLDALVVDIADLYPDESMLLHGIKMFSGAHIDEAILTAASLAVRSGGPLAKIFLRIIENKEELLSEVDSLVYEQGMGLSGWVDGRRVFVGNRRLLQNHSVDVPSLDYEARYAKDGRRLVYLSMGGQLSAMFVVSYLPDPEIQEALQDLCRSHVTLLVRSCDPNMTTQDLCENFDLDEYYVDVMPASAGRAYMQLAERTNESMPAVMASNGHILGTAWALSVCRSLQTKAFMALLVQTAASIFGVFLCLIWALQGPLDLVRLLLVSALSLFATLVVPLFKRT